MPETAIAEHGPVEDLHTAALVGTDGSIGSIAHGSTHPGVNGALLDDERPHS